MAKNQNDVNVNVGTKFPYPELKGDESKEAKAEVLRIRAESTRNATRDVVAGVIHGNDDTTVRELKELYAEALAFLGARSERRKGVAGQGVARAPKGNVVADYFKGNVAGDKVDASSVFFDLDMDPARVLGALKRFVSTVKDTSARVWVSYDKASRSYIVAGHGADVPKGFTAYAVESNASDVA